MRHLLTTLMLMASATIMAQPVTTQMQAGRTAEGITYFLPKTALRFHLLIEKKTYTPGEYAKFAEKYLHITGIEQQQQVSYGVAHIDVTSVGVRDTSKCYSVVLKGKSETAEVRLSEDGVLLAVNDEPLKQREHAAFRPAPCPAMADARRFLNADVLAAGSTAKQAELTARQLMELLEHRQQLITGEADDMPQDEQQLRHMVEQIDQEREALMTLFTGITKCDTTEHVITMCPDKEVSREVVFRISRKLGLVDKDDLSGVPYYITIEDLYHANSQKYPAPVSKKSSEGFFVNVPGRIRLTLHRENQQLSAFDIQAAQFGFVELRGGSLFKRYVAHMTLNPATGAVDRLYSDIGK